MYALEIKPELQKILSKLSKKDKKTYEAVMKKIEEILENPQHYKPLRYDLAGERRAHIMKSFVLKFEVNEATKTVCFIFFGHHDEAYKR
ncbi:MAG: type II toxin-antitoxin system RelE/ParE family toxin [Nanoarchaeota archaeon]